MSEFQNQLHKSLVFLILFSHPLIVKPHKPIMLLLWVNWRLFMPGMERAACGVGEQRPCQRLLGKAGGKLEGGHLKVLLLNKGIF